MRLPTQRPMPQPWPPVVPSRPGEPLLGRRRELADLRRALGSARLVTLTGQGGIGKTTLARGAATDHERARREDTWAVDLADLVDPDLLGHSVAGAFGVQLPYGAAGAADVAAAVADRAGLLVLDGCEAMLDAAVELVAVLLATAPRLRVLATSHRHLGVTGEVVVPVGPLAADEAQALFAARAAAALPSFRLTDDNAAAVARLCEALEWVPLAIELAAARIVVLSPQGILDRLGDRQRLLAKGARGAPARHRSLRASLEASNELCTPDERLLWARLSVFTGGFPLEAAEVVCAGDGIDGADVLDLVDGLLEKSVLTREDDGASYVRFRMLESLREYAAEQLTEEQLQAGRDRHLAWYADLVRAAKDASFGPGQAGWYRTLRREHANLREALRHALDEPRHAVQALELVTALEPYWAVTGRLSEARHWLARASAVAEGDAGARARALAMAAWMAVLQGDPGTGRSVLDEAAALLAGDAADDAVRARVLVARAAETIWRDSPGEALTLLEEAVTAARTAGGRPLESSALFLLGLCRGFAGDLDGADTALQECVDLSGPAGEVHVRSYALAALGMLALLRGDPDAAADLERQALEMKMDLGDRSGTALVLEVLAWVAAAERRQERAATLVGASDVLWRHLGVDPDAIPYLSGNRRRSEEHAGIDRGGAAFRAAFRRGEALSDEQILALALEQTPVEEAPEEQVPLTRRELEVAHLVGCGLSNREMAEQLRISQRTVESHVDHILRKLGFGSRTQVVAWVVEREARHR
ncbi:MAG TPA: LuxR C-terminal-related transcriptional regulator [Nocardioidaceae bacterium]|nr:LuxR C-terminal-related transcriptional regulator [Nocardioidaceae bacterium]